ncbi:transcription factor NAI1-like [Phragmites australis]|uniref:transcription factor NAI1-like n=1 Tax=Phragmites australis TaxID=29695 RepID=UPI002D7A2E80|nr:transcription factor NAI1-like [Phragmites australis]XP_062203540.1 transcription factor NAI1-like [Phragmites australis]XP_062203541.1 transcription factor NAI1-like [Phragmites australis]XP_062203542.1 transcription factor NAI1-like [Phragmites australis]
MDDSSMFLQWAMNQLHEHPPAAAACGYQDGGGSSRMGGGRDEEAAFPSLQALPNASQSQSQNATAGVRDLTVQVDHLANSWSSSDSPGAVMDHDAAAGWSPHTARARTTGLGGSSNSRPMSWNFSAAALSMAQTTDETGGGVAVPEAAASARAQAPARRVGSAGPAAVAASSSPVPVQDHIIAERRRREKINQRVIELSTVIPGLKKMDKATILGDAVKYVRELQEKVKSLEEEGARNAGNGIQSAVLVKKPCRVPDDEGAASGSNGGLPEIVARLSEKSVLLRIHCDSARGLLVTVLSEVEQMHLSITHTNVIPFPASTVIITITAKVEEGFNATVDDIIRRINSVLHQHYSSNSEETRR